MDTLGRYSGIASEVLGGFSGYNQKIGTKKRKSTAKHQIQFAYRPRQSIVAHRPSVAKPQGHRVSVKPLATTGKHRGSMAVKTMSQSTVLKPAMNSRTGSMWTSGTGPSRRHLRLKSNAQVDNFKAFEDLKEGEISEIQDIADREIHIRLIEIWNHLIDQKGILTCEKYQLLGTQISQLTKIPVAATIVSTLVDHFYPITYYTCMQTTPSISFKCFTTRILLESARFTGSEKPQDQTKFLNDLDVAISDALTIDGELVKKAWTVLSKQRKRYHAMLYQNAIHKAFGSNVNSRTPETYVEFTKRISKVLPNAIEFSLDRKLILCSIAHQETENR